LPSNAKVNTVFKQLNVFEEMQREFLELGMKKEDASSIIDDLRKTVNHAAQALQVLRRAMGDTHGSRLDSAKYGL